MSSSANARGRDQLRHGGSNRNAVHLRRILILAWVLGGRVLRARLRVGNLLTFRLTALGLWRPRLDTTRSSKSSSRTS